MDYNSTGEKVPHRVWKDMYNAFQNGQELVNTRLTSRRDLVMMGLLSSTGTFIALRVPIPATASDEAPTVEPDLEDQESSAG